MDSTRLQDLLSEAKGVLKGKAKIRPVVLGPVSFLLLSKGSKEPLKRLDFLLPIYEQLFAELDEYEQIQLKSHFWLWTWMRQQKKLIKKHYSRLAAKARLFVTSYFAPQQDNAELILDQPIQTLHIDLVNSSQAEVETVLNKLGPGVKLSAGVVNGSNIWRNNLRQSLALLQQIADKIGKDRLIVSSSCSLLHSPVDLIYEEGHLSADCLPTAVFFAAKTGRSGNLGQGSGTGGRSHCRSSRG